MRATASAGGRVLVVDDEAAIRGFVAQALEAEGYAVATAADGVSAFDLARAAPPDVILLDLRLPVLDGWAFARAYRRLPPPRAPLVVMTAAVDARRWGAEVGADGCLPKPFDLEELLACVAAHAGRGPAG
jgi:DNA-binding response OmpR family regulator